MIFYHFDANSVIFYGNSIGYESNAFFDGGCLINGFISVLNMNIKKCRNQLSLSKMVCLISRSTQQYSESEGVCVEDSETYNERKKNL